MHQQPGRVAREREGAGTKGLTMGAAESAAPLWCHLCGANGGHIERRRPPLAPLAAFPVTVLFVLGWTVGLLPWYSTNTSLWPCVAANMSYWLAGYLFDDAISNATRSNLVVLPPQAAL